MWHKRTCLQNGDSQPQRTDVCLPRTGERDRLGVWGRLMQTIKFRMDKYQAPAVWHRELCYIQSPGINHDGKGYFKKNVYMFKNESLSCIDWHNIVNQLYFNLQKRRKKKRRGFSTYGQVEHLRQTMKGCLNS